MTMPSSRGVVPRSRRGRADGAYQGRAALVAACAAALVACGNGSGPTATGGGPGRDAPVVTWDQPPATRDQPGNGCIVCDVSYECSANFGNIELASSMGQCTQSTIDIICSGALFAATSCSGGGGGAFTCGNVTCVPAPQGGTGFGFDGG